MVTMEIVYLIFCCVYSELGVRAIVQKQSKGEYLYIHVVHDIEYTGYHWNYASL